MSLISRVFIEARMISIIVVIGRTLPRPYWIRELGKAMLCSQYPFDADNKMFNDNLRISGGAEDHHEFD
jgi:hypothetical protein